jgi:hypothetical protein
MLCLQTDNKYLCIRHNAYDNNIPKSSCYFRRVLKLRKATSGFVITVRLSAASKFAWNNSASTERIFVEVYFAEFFSNAYRKFKFGKKKWKIYSLSGILRVNEDPRMFMIIACCLLLGRGKVSDTIFRQNINTSCLNTWFKKMGFEIVNYENIAQTYRPHRSNTTRNKRMFDLHAVHIRHTCF